MYRVSNHPATSIVQLGILETIVFFASDRTQVIYSFILYFRLITVFAALQETVNTLRRQQQERGDSLVLHLPSALLEEKNLEIDHLNQQVLRLQQELDSIKENKVTCLFI